MSIWLFVKENIIVWILIAYILSNKQFYDFYIYIYMKLIANIIIDISDRQLQILLPVISSFAFQ